MTRRTLATVAAALGVLMSGSAALATPYVPTTSVLPPVAPAGPGADFSAECGTDGLACVRFVEAQLTGWESFLGCDHRAVFATVYKLLTARTREVLERDPGMFEDPAGLGKEALEFYELYEQMIGAHLDDGEVPPAWQRAMDAAAEGDWTAGHDMLLGISAHVQRDMPFAVAATGLQLPDGSSRKGDHDSFNEVLNEAYPIIVAAVGERYDPFMTDIETYGGDGANASSMQLVAGWREGVWRNAEALTSSDGSPLHDVVVAQIESNADTWGAFMSSGEIPGRRELRDAHCAAATAGEPRGVRPDPAARPDVDTAPGDGGTAPAAPDEQPPDAEPSERAGDDLAATGGGTVPAALAVMGMAALLGRNQRTRRR